MNDQEPTDKLLDKVVARIQGSEVPDYPGPPIIGDLSVLQSPANPRRRLLAALSWYRLLSRGGDRSFDAA